MCFELIHVILLQGLAPTLPMHKVEMMVDLHARAKSCINLFKGLGCYEVLSEYDFVDGYYTHVHILLPPNVLLPFTEE
jgi:hypothetical protein